MVTLSMHKERKMDGALPKATYSFDCIHLKKHSLDRGKWVFPLDFGQVCLIFGQVTWFDIQHSRRWLTLLKVIIMASLDWPSADNKQVSLAYPKNSDSKLFKALFWGLIITICNPSAGTLASSCATCHAFSVEATPVFCQLATSKVVMLYC